MISENRCLNALDRFRNLTPYITAIWLVIGIVAVLMLRSRNPAAVERIGSILGEEGGEDAKLISA